MKSIILITLISLLIFQQPAYSTASNSRPWILYTPTDDAANENLKPHFVSKTMDLKTLTTTFLSIDDYNVKPTNIDKNKKIKIINIGQLNGIKVYDVIYPLVDKKDEKKYLKVIYLEKQPDQYIPVYYSLDVNLEDEKNIKSFLLTDKNLVVSKLLIPGSGAYVQNFYLYVSANILSNKNEIPHVISTKIISEIVKKTIPKNYFLANGDPFDIKTLTFSSCVTLEIHCFGSKEDGMIDMQFKLDKDELKLVNLKYKTPNFSHPL